MTIVAIKKEEKQPQPPRKSNTHEERYVHFNVEKDFVEEAGNVKEPIFPDCRFSHVTMFLRKEDDGLWYMSVALCNKVDDFCRATGRQTARRKYFQNDAKTLWGDDDPTYDEIKVVVQQTIEEQQ